jgi:hypothetical protein
LEEEIFLVGEEAPKYKFDWDAFFDRLNLLERLVGYLLITHKHLLLIEPKDEDLKKLELKFKTVGLPFKRAHIELKKMQLGCN